MAWQLEPFGQYNPFSRGDYSGLSAWRLSNAALSNLSQVANSGIAAPGTENLTAAAAQAASPGLRNAMAGQEGLGGAGPDMDSNVADFGMVGAGTPGFGTSPDFGSWAMNLATAVPSVLAGPVGAVTFAGRTIASMINDRDRIYGLGDVFGGRGPSKGPDWGPPAPEMYGPDMQTGMVAGKPGPQSLGDYAFGPSPEADPASAENAENNAPDAGKSETPADGGTKAAAGGLASYAPGGLLAGETDGMSDEIPAGVHKPGQLWLSGGEYIMPADIVSALGNGNTTAGGKVIDKAIEKLRRMKYGRKKQPPIFEGTLEDLL